MPEILDITYGELRPYDMLEEGRSVKSIAWPPLVVELGTVVEVGRVVEVGTVKIAIDVGVVPAGVRPIELWTPEWTDVEECRVNPHDRVRVVRGVPVPRRR